jgi:hypothetical protein
VQATAQPYVQSTGAFTIANGGTGYTVGNVLTFSGGTGVVNATATVASVSAGVITGLTFTSGGAYTVVPTNPISVTGGTGTGATFNFTQYILRTGAPTWLITNAGSGYVEQPTVTFSGGGGSGAAAYARIGSDVTVKGLGTNLDFSTPNGTGLRVLDGGQTSAAYWSVGGGTNAVFRTVGNAAAYFDNNNAQPLIFRTATSSEQLRVSHTASAVNFVQVTGAGTGSSPMISAQGSDATLNLTLGSKGSGSSVLFQANGLNAFQVSGTGTIVNRLRASGAIAGASPILDVVGSDTNIDLALTPKGTGLVRFGTYTASMALTVQGFIEVKDSGGTIRKLAVIA